MAAREGFTAEQRRELRENLKLLPEQVHEIESVALPSIRAWLQQQPPKQDVRAKLSDVAKALRSAEKAVTSLIGGTGASLSKAKKISPTDSALARVFVASFDAGLDGDVLDHTLSSLSGAIVVVEQATKSLPPTPTRHRTASPYCVGLVDNALLSGFLKAHGCWPGTAGADSRPPLPPYLIVPSSAEGSDYRRIVELSYEAAGEVMCSRERAIKTFIAQRKKATTESRARILKSNMRPGTEPPQKI